MSPVSRGRQVAARGPRRRGRIRPGRLPLASVSAWPLPRCGSGDRRAAARRDVGRPSREPSSATITSASGNCRFSSGTVVPIRASSRAQQSGPPVGIHPLGDEESGSIGGNNRRRPCRGYRFLPSRGPASTEHEHKPAKLGVSITVHRRQNEWRWKTRVALCSTQRELKPPTTGTPGPPRGPAVRDQPGHGPLAPGLRLGRPDDDDAIRWITEAASALLPYDLSLRSHPKK